MSSNSEERLQQRVETLSAHLDVADSDLAREHARGEALLLKLFCLLDRGDLHSALEVIDAELGPRGQA